MSVNLNKIYFLRKKWLFSKAKSNVSGKYFLLFVGTQISESV